MGVDAAPHSVVIDPIQLGSPQRAVENPQERTEIYLKKKQNKGVFTLALPFPMTGRLALFQSVWLMAIFSSSFSHNLHKQQG